MPLTASLDRSVQGRLKFGNCCDNCFKCGCFAQDHTRHCTIITPKVVEHLTFGTNGECGGSRCREIEATGYEVAKGRKRLVVVNLHGKSFSMTSDLEVALGGGFKV